MRKKVAVFLAEGFEEIEALSVVDILRRAGTECKIIGIEDEMVKGAHDVIIKVDETINKEDIKKYDMLVFPGGMPGAVNLSNNNDVIDLIKYFNDNNKYIAAICASPAVVLSKSGVVDSKNITCYPTNDFKNMLSNSNYKDDNVVVDGNIITSRGPATALEFAYKILEILGYDYNKIMEDMLYNK